MHGRMEQVLNPLYDTHSLMSPQRNVPKPSQKQQQQQERKQSSQPQAPGRFRHWRKACFSGTPWLVVLAVAVLIAAQVVWAVHTDKFVAAAQQLMDRAAIEVPPQLASAMYILKAVLIGVTSFLGGMMLLLGVAVKRQRLAKRSAATRADWPHGCKSHTTMSISVALAMLLWMVAAGYVGLLCCTFSATGVALTGDVAAGQALSLASDSPPTLQQLQASLKRAQTAFSGAVQRAPPVIKRMPWFDDLTGSVSPAFSSQGTSNSTAQADDDTCPATCLNLRLVTRLLHSSSDSPTGACLCVKAALQQAQQLLRDMWLDGLVAFIALSVLAALATWMLIYCLVVCIITWRDHVEAKHCKYLLQQEEQQDGNINRWMWTAGIASPTSNSETMSSFPAFEHPGDAKRPTQLLAPELTASTLSPSPRKQGKRQQQQQDQDMLQSAGDAQAESDIERPPQMLPDQLPVQPVPAQYARGNLQQLPAATLVAATPTLADGASRSADHSTTGRRDVHRSAASNSDIISTSSYRRRWQEGQSAARR